MWWYHSLFSLTEIFLFVCWLCLFTHSTANPSNKFLYSWELIDRRQRKPCFKTYAKLFQNLEYLFKQDSCEDRIMYWSCFESWWYFLLYQNLSSCPIEMNQHSSVFVLNLITMVLSSYFLYIYRICFHSCQKVLQGCVIKGISIYKTCAKKMSLRDCLSRMLHHVQPMLQASSFCRNTNYNSS